MAILDVRRRTRRRVRCPQIVANVVFAARNEPAEDYIRVRSLTLTNTGSTGEGCKHLNQIGLSR